MHPPTRKYKWQLRDRKQMGKSRDFGRNCFDTEEQPFCERIFFCSSWIGISPLPYFAHLPKFRMISRLINQWVEDKNHFPMVKRGSKISNHTWLVQLVIILSGHYEQPRRTKLYLYMFGNYSVRVCMAEFFTQIKSIPSSKQQKLKMDSTESFDDRSEMKLGGGRSWRQEIIAANMKQNVKSVLHRFVLLFERFFCFHFFIFPCMNYDNFVSNWFAHSFTESNELRFIFLSLHQMTQRISEP